jgi:hypothetical protein
MGISTDKLGPPPRKPNKVSCILFSCIFPTFLVLMFFLFVYCTIFCPNMSRYCFETTKTACKNLTGRPASLFIEVGSL